MNLETSTSKYNLKLGDITYPNNQLKTIVFTIMMKCNRHTKT